MNLEKSIGEVLKPYEKTIRNTIVYGGLGVVSIPLAMVYRAYEKNKSVLNSPEYKSMLKVHAKDYAKIECGGKSLFDHLMYGLGFSMALPLVLVIPNISTEKLETKDNSIEVSKLTLSPKNNFDLLPSLALFSLTNYYSFRNSNPNNYIGEITQLDVNSEEISCKVSALEWNLDLDSFNFKNSPESVTYFINGKSTTNKLLRNPIEKVCQQILDRDKSKLRLVE